MKFKKAMSILMAVAMVTGLASVNVMAAEETEETTLTMWSWSPITRTCEKMLEDFE